MKRTLRWLLVRFIPLIGFVAVGALVAGNAYRIYGQYKLDEDFAPPGKLISIGSHRMHIHCLGSGRPVVVMDAGAGGFSTAWSWIHGPTASFTRVCAFDRSGMGWSESGPANPTPKSRARELEALLAASGEPPPYLLVGHSLGGAVAWLYTQDHLEQAAGFGLPPDLGDHIPRAPNRALLARAIFRLPRSRMPTLIFVQPCSRGFTVQCDSGFSQETATCDIPIGETRTSAKGPRVASASPTSEAGTIDSKPVIVGRRQPGGEARTSMNAPVPW